ncbi:MAG: hypothetical protein ACJAYU_003927 [Bradymonadia bacterium]
MSAAVVSPDGASSLLAGDIGFIVNGWTTGAGADRLGVRWTDWTSGHDGNGQFNAVAAGCGLCEDGPTDSTSYVDCDDLAGYPP